MICGAPWSETEAALARTPWSQLGKILDFSGAGRRLKS